MSKRRFVQAVVIRAQPPLDKLEACVAYAENLWSQLHRYGYGAEAETKPRASKDWFATLSPVSQAGFLQFWEAFSYKKGRNEAAMRWAQLGDLSKEDTVNIIEAARKEAGRQIPQGQARKMAEGWLFEKRWLDYQAQPVCTKNNRIVQLNHLRNELNALEVLNKAAPCETLNEQIARLKTRMAELKQERV